MTGGVDMLEAQALGHDRTVRAFSENCGALPDPPAAGAD
jgi:hypothetical protein